MTGLQKPGKKQEIGSCKKKTYNKLLISLEKSVFTAKSQTPALPYWPRNPGL